MRQKGSVSLLSGREGHVKLTLLGTIGVFILTLAFLVVLNAPVQAFVTKGTSCSAASCHGVTNTSATISTALNGVSGTSITVTPGTTFEVDWMFTNMVYTTTKYDGVNPELAVPTGWTVARGTANSPALTNWNSVWDATDGVTTGWNTTYSTATEFPGSPVGYSVDYNGTSWDSGNRNAAWDNAGSGDLDGVANRMGTDARITVPAGAAAGQYTVMVLGIGHDSGDSKAHVERAITITVASGTAQSPPVSVTGPSSITYGNTATITYSGGQGTGAMSYSHGASTGCTVNSTSGLITVTNASGTCSVTATKAGDGTYAPSTSSPYTVTLNKATQGAVSVSVPASAFYQQTGLSASASGGSGTGAYSYSHGASTACTVNSSTGALTITSGTGTCSITATRATDNNYLVSAASLPATVTITKANQATLSITAPSSVTYGSTGTITTSGGSGTGAMSYDHGLSTGCTVNPTTGVISVASVAGSCSVSATKATDTNYNVAISSGYAVTLNKATPTLSVANPSVTYNGSAQAAIVNGSVAGSVSNVLYNGSSTVPTNANTYTITANFSPTDSTNYNSLTGASAGNFIINPATPTASISNTPVIYNGSAQTAMVACLGGGTATLASGGTGTNAGSYPATVDCAASTNYSAASGLTPANGNFVINPATPTASISNTPVTYNGSAQTATVACLGGGTATLASGGTGTNAGSYPATVDCAASTNYSAASGLTPANGNFVINQATPTASISNTPVTYNGSAQTATVACLGGGTATLASGGTGTNAGSYPATVDCAASTNYSAASGLTPANGNFVINQATPTASISNTPVTYNGSAQTATVACLGGGTATLASGGTGTNAGSYPATIDCAASTNYSAASGLTPTNGNFVINKATPNLSVINSPVVYDGSPKSAQVDGSVPGTASNILTGGAATQTAIGIYPVTADFAPTDGTNYNSLTTASAGNFEISAATQTASISNSPVTYNGSPQAAAVTCSGAGVVTNVRYNGSSTVPTNAATYAVVVDCGANGGFSETTNISAGNFIISKADQGAVSVTAPANAYYNQAGLTAIASGGSGTGAYSYSAGLSTACTVDSSTGALTINSGTGTCSITATRATDANYNISAASSPANVTISKATAAVTLSNLSQAYDGTPKSVTVTTVPDGLTVDVTYDGLPTAPTAAASYTVIATVSDTNYDGTATDTLVITGASTATLSVTIEGTGSGTVNDGSTLTCTSGICTADYTTGTPVTLMATASGNAIFAGWSGACTGAEDCILTMDGPKSVTATFNNPPLIKIGETPYATILSAYTAILDGATMQLTARTFTEDLLFDRAVSISLEGGKSDDYLSTSGSTIIDGSLTITNGTVSTKDIVIQ